MADSKEVTIPLNADIYVAQTNSFATQNLNPNNATAGNNNNGATGATSTIDNKKNVNTKEGRRNKWIIPQCWCGPDEYDPVHDYITNREPIPVQRN